MVKTLAEYRVNICESCPYYNKEHLLNTDYYDIGEPLELENNNSRILLVFEAPGIEEWRSCAPLQPVNMQGGSAGIRLEASWTRMNKQRDNFDITNTVQCFPGKMSDKRVNDPVPMAVERCNVILRNDILNGNYEKVIAFGKFAQNSVSQIRDELGLNFDYIQFTHPNGGVRNEEIDSLWE